MIKKWILLLSSVGFCLTIFAVNNWANALTISVSGASGYVQDTTTNTNLTVYAGYAFPENCDASTRDNVSTCNSCTGTASTLTSPAPCSEQSIYDTLQFSITVTSDKTDINLLKVGVAKSTTYSGNELTTLEPTDKVNGKSYYFNQTWSAVLSSLASLNSKFDLACTVNCGGAATFYIGPVNSNNEFVEKIAVTVKFSLAGTTNIDERALTNVCSPPAVAGNTDTYIGLCHYQMYPGDDKAYIIDQVVGFTGKKDSVTGLSFTHLVMFYGEGASSDALNSIKAIKNNNPKATIELSDDDTAPFKESAVKGLENDKSFCFLPAMKDETGVISYFLDVAKLKSTIQPSETQLSGMCATPSEVVGVLGDKNCFVATATFGSGLHPYIQILRTFRDQILIKNTLGRKFVKFYYKEGPVFAAKIKDSEGLRLMSRVILLPIIGITFLILNPLWFFVILFILGILLLIFKKKMSLKHGLTVFILIFLSITLFTQQSLALQAQNNFQDEFADDLSVTPSEAAPSESSTHVIDQNQIKAKKENEINLSAETEEDVPPNEPPYVKTEDEKKALEASKDIPEEKKPEVSISKEANHDLNSNLDSSKKYITHPNSAKGLYLIDQSTGKYYYKTKKIAKKNQATSIRLGTMSAPKISVSAIDKNNNQVSYTFDDIYQQPEVPLLLIDYEWQPFRSFGKLGVVFGGGFFTATGKGRFKYAINKPSIEAKESYTFIGIPVNVGGIYRLEFASRQWMAPFVSGGLSYYLLAEIRDDGKKTKVIGSPAGYGSAGMLFNITAWDKQIAFTMDREYGISNMWLSAEYRYVQSLNEDIDLSSSIINLGISVDY